MAYCQIFEHPDLTPEKAEQVMAHVRTTGPVLPEGARLLVVGSGERGMRVITIWDSNEARERFLSERLSASGGPLARWRCSRCLPATSPAHRSRLDATSGERRPLFGAPLVHVRPR
jgi:hypothetical protein